MNKWYFKTLCKLELQLLNRETVWHHETAGVSVDRKGLPLVPVGAKKLIVQMDLGVAWGRV